MADSGDMRENGLKRCFELLFVILNLGLANPKNGHPGDDVGNRSFSFNSALERVRLFDKMARDLGYPSKGFIWATSFRTFATV